MPEEYEYSFGHLQWQGEDYRKDLIILPDRIISDWWREQGHHLQKGDLLEVIQTAPRVLVIGTGAHGVMKVPDELLEELAELGIDAQPMPTDKALARFVEVRKTKMAAAALHLTC